MQTQLELAGFTIDIQQKNIKNLHLGVYPPQGSVRISAPLRMDLATIRIFALTKLPWIKKQQQKLQQQARESPRDYIDRESHYVFGQRCLLNIVASTKPPCVEHRPYQLYLHISLTATTEQKQALLEAWYREQLKALIPPLIARWEPIMTVKVKQFFVQRMKTRWGSCNLPKQSIRLNTELAKKPHGCLEYIIVHEMVHLLEPSHNHCFKTLMSQFMPAWQSYRALLNQSLLSHEVWKYPSAKLVPA